MVEFIKMAFRKNVNKRIRTEQKLLKVSLVHVYEAEAEASAVSMRIRQKVKHEASGEVSRSHLRVRTLQNGR